jgi:cobalt-zinc-cadmium efflux system membrane fusion protein
MTGKASISRQFVISMGVIVALGAGGFLLTRKAGVAANAADPPSQAPANTISETGRRVLEIGTEPVHAEVLEHSIQATGLISFPADQTVKISPRLQGRIRQVFVGVGDRVAAGQILAVLDSVDAAAVLTNARQAANKLRLAKTNLERQRRLYRLGTPDVTQAQASLDQAAARTRFTRDALDRVREQARIGGFTQKPLADAQNDVVAARADLAQAEADLAQAERERDRTARLVEIGIAAKRDLEAAENAVKKAGVTVQADTEKVALHQQSLEREKKAYAANLYADQQVRSAESDYRQAVLQQEAAARTLQLAKAAVLRDLEQSRSDYEAAHVDAENTRRVVTLLGDPGNDGSMRITSPIAGTVVERNVNSGQVVDQSQVTPWQMFIISNTDTVWVDADVYEKDISAIAPGEPVEIRAAALPNRRFMGTVRRIAPSLDPKTRAVKVRSEITNREGLLKDGMFAEVTLRPRHERTALVVPMTAIQHEGDRDYVYVAEGRKYAKRAVQLGTQRDGHCVVENGLRSGERVVTRGAIFLGGEANDG